MTLPIVKLGKSNVSFDKDVIFVQNKFNSKKLEITKKEQIKFLKVCKSIEKYFFGDKK